MHTGSEHHEKCLFRCWFAWLFRRAAVRRQGHESLGAGYILGQGAMAVVLQNLYESKGTSFTSALAVSRQSSTSQKADPEFVLKPIAEGLLHNIAQLVVPNGKGKIDDDAATRAAIRAEADAIGESDIEAIMFEEYEWQDREQIGTLINVSPLRNAADRLGCLASSAIPNRNCFLCNPHS